MCYDWLLQQHEFVRHVETTMARSLYNCDEGYVVRIVLLSWTRFMVDFCRAAYAGTALALRDRLIIEWNKTQQAHTTADQKRVYCMTVGFSDI